MTENKARGLAEEYVNLFTLSWATIYDKNRLVEEHRIKAEYLRDQLQENDLYRSYWGQDLYVPDDVPDWKVDQPLSDYNGRYPYPEGTPYRKSEKLSENNTTGDQ